LAAPDTSCELKKLPTWPCADHRQVDVSPLNPRKPILVAGDHLGLHADAGGEVLNAGHFFSDRVGVFGRERARGPRSAADAALREVARVHGDHVGAGALDLILDH